MENQQIQKPKYVYLLRRKDGRTVCYYRRPGCVAIPLPLPVGSPEFTAAHASAVEESKRLVKRRRKSGLHPASSERLLRAVKGAMSDCGVYMLIRKGRVIYVGTSGNCAERIAEHRQNGREFDRAFYIFCEGSEREWLEALLIRQLDPEQNKRIPTPRTRIERVQKTAA